MTDTKAAAWLRPRLVFGAIAGAVVWAVWLASLSLGGFTRDAEGQLLGADHIAFYSAATLLRNGRPGDIYDHNSLGGVQQQITGGTWPYFMAYRNPPFYALLYVPTAALTFPASVLVWMTLSVAALGIAVWCLRPERPWRAFGWAFAFYPFFAAISFGQNTPLSLAIFAAVYRLSSDRRPFLAGLAAGLLWFKPQLLIGVFVWWGLAPWRHRFEWLGVALTGAALAVLSFVAIPEAAWAFVESLRSNVSYGGENGWNLHSPRAFWRLLLPDAPAALTWALTGVCALMAICGAALVHARTGGPLAVMFPVAVFLSLWVSPHTLIYEWALLFAAAVVLWERLPGRRDTWLTLFAVAWGVLTVSTTATLVQIRYLPLPFAFQLSIPVLAFVGVRVIRTLGERYPTPDAGRT
jgi:alpha-1,2-mannosyltransferase